MKYDFSLTSEQQALVEANMGLVGKVIRIAIHPDEHVCGMSYEDLYQEGCVALCRAAATFRPGGCKFSTYAFPVIRNHLYDCCRAVQSSLHHIQTVSLESLSSTLPECPAHEEAAEQRISEQELLGLLLCFKEKYKGSARLGIEAMEWRVRGYTGEEIAQLYHVKPNYIRACISRSAQKLRQEREMKDYYAWYAGKEARSA